MLRGMPAYSARLNAGRAEAVVWRAHSARRAVHADGGAAVGGPTKVDAADAGEGIPAAPARCGVRSGRFQLMTRKDSDEESDEWRLSFTLSFIVFLATSHTRCTSNRGANRPGPSVPAAIFPSIENDEDPRRNIGG